MATTLLLTFLSVAAQSQTSELEQHLRDQYQGKTRLLRGFYVGDSLFFDSAGNLIGKEISGDWTTEGFVVLDDIHQSGPRLIIEAHRLLVTRLTPELGFSAAKRRSAQGNRVEPALLEIDIDFEKAPLSAEQVSAAMSRIFLTEQDSLADLVPAYWKSCVRDGLAWKNENCRFSGEVMAIPGMTLYDNSPTSSPVRVEGSQLAPSRQLFRVGSGVTPPRAIFQPNPEFSESARAVKYQGKATLGLIVSAEGKPMKVRILSPLGAGLDAKAVHAVESWRFEPATRDGQPVSVEIAVEVDFHLY